MEIKALTITQYLIQGDPNGLVACYVSNWTGQCLKFPRNLLGIAKARDEFKRPGIYFLIGDDPDGINKWKVYVGESEGLDSRLSEHDRDLRKEFWEQAIIFSSKDENLTKGHVRYLEFRLHEELKNQKRVRIENINSSRPKLPEASRDEMETYLDFLKLLLPVLGFPFFDISSPKELGVKEVKLILKMSGQRAEGYLTPNGMLVKRDSTVSPITSKALSSNYSALRNTLVDQRIIDATMSKFLDDYEFSSPSAAAAVILGYNVNGRDAWKTSNNVSINQLEQSSSL